MNINPVLYYDRKIRVYDDNFLMPLNPNEILLDFTITCKIDKLNIMFSSNEKEFLNYFNSYFTFSNNFEELTSILLVKIRNTPFNFKDIKWTDGNSNTNKGVDSWGNIIYLIDDIYVKKSPSSLLIDIYVPHINLFNKNMPIIIKLIEGAICDYFIDLGYVPVHSSLVSNEESATLIIGHSQSGKTTLAQKFMDKKYKILSDEYTFVRSDGLIPFGHYIKYYENINNDSLAIENFGDVNRFIYKLDNTYENINLENIIIQRLHSKNDSYLSSYDLRINSDILLKYLHSYPNEFFIDKTITYSMLINITKFLSRKSINFRDSAYI